MYVPSCRVYRVDRVVGTYVGSTTARNTRTGCCGRKAGTEEEDLLMHRVSQLARNEDDEKGGVLSVLLGAQGTSDNWQHLAVVDPFLFLFKYSVTSARLTAFFFPSRPVGLGRGPAALQGSRVPSSLLQVSARPCPSPWRTCRPVLGGRHSACDDKVFYSEERRTTTTTTTTMMMLVVVVGYWIL